MSQARHASLPPHSLGLNSVTGPINYPGRRENGYQQALKSLPHHCIFSKGQSLTIGSSQQAQIE